MNELLSQFCNCSQDRGAAVLHPGLYPGGLAHPPQGLRALRGRLHPDRRLLPLLALLGQDHRNCGMSC